MKKDDMAECPSCGNRECLRFKVGDEVYDELTGAIHRVTHITLEYQEVWIDSNYLNGRRFPWDLTHVRFLKSC